MALRPKCPRRGKRSSADPSAPPPAPSAARALVPVHPALRQRPPLPGPAVGPRTEGPASPWGRAATPSRGGTALPRASHGASSVPRDPGDGLVHVRTSSRLKACFQVRRAMPAAFCSGDGSANPTAGRVHRHGGPQTHAGISPRGLGRFPALHTSPCWPALLVSFWTG